MNKESQKALQQLTGKPDFNQVSVEELQQLADAHPYFAAAQLLLLQKMKQEQHTQLPKQLYKTALCFPNEQWLRYLLSDNEKETINTAETVYSDNSTATVPEPAKETKANEEETAEITEDINLITLPAEQILGKISDTDTAANEPQEAPLDEDEFQQQSEKLTFASNNKLTSLLSGQAEQFSKPVADHTELSTASEPFHTVDYFASQGIKLDAKREENPFDKKVHKFTDWLRQMKRINPQPVDLGTETEEETAVANIADSSNYTKAVLTESMADVLVKQDKPDKAIEIYQKLSLLNPDKSVYFAGLIQKIK